MRHYEIIFLVHPDQSEQVPMMLERYKNIVKNYKGTIHRCEDLGRRGLAYPINKVHKAHYALLNIESNLEALNEITESFKFNDAILRYLVLQRKQPINVESCLLKAKDDSHKEEGERW